MKQITRPQDGSARSPIAWPVVMLVIILLPLGSISPALVAGLLLGYIIGYHLDFRQRKLAPRLWPLPLTLWRPILISGALAFLGSLWLPALPTTIPFGLSVDGIPIGMTVHLGLAGLCLYGFIIWRRRTLISIHEQHRHGTSRFATKGELKPYRLPKRPGTDTKPSIYIGAGKYGYDKQGHLLCIAGTRGGKGVNLILPNLLGAGTFSGSMVIVDPKGENAAISANYQRSLGKTVRILNPWDLHGLDSCCYNPFDLISDPDSLHLADDAQLLAQMIVPSLPGNDNHWNNRARSLISALLMHQATSGEHELTAVELWQLLRLPADEWLDLLAAMALNPHPVSGPVINGAGNELLTLMEHSEKEATGIISTAQRWTDVFKSIPLQRSLATSDFSLSELSDGNTVLYIIIPADKLKTHYAWLRLLVATAMKAVVRRPHRRVLFLLDECYALGYLAELEIALGTYAGYGISIWAIFQSLVQIKDLYRDNWENFIANSGVIHAFGLNDRTTAQYISDLTGRISVASFTGERITGVPSSSSSRALMTSDEARSLRDHMLVFIDNLPPAYLPQLPYYTNPVWSNRADPNPYISGASATFSS